MKSLSQSTQKWFLHYSISQSLLQLDKVFDCVNSRLVGCSIIQELMSKIFAGLTGRCQHPSLHTKYIISATKPAMENWRIQIQVPEGMLCLVSAINALTRSPHWRLQYYCFPPIYGARIYLVANQSAEAGKKSVWDLHWVNPSPISRAPRTKCGHQKNLIAQQQIPNG